MEKYVVIDVLTSEVKIYCEQHNIKVETDGKYLTFSGQESDLKNLHNEFYEDYEFELSDVDYDEDYERSWGPKEDEDDE